MYTQRDFFHIPSDAFRCAAAAADNGNDYFTMRADKVCFRLATRRDEKRSERTHISFHICVFVCVYNHCRAHLMHNETCNWLSSPTSMSLCLDYVYKYECIRFFSSSSFAFQSFIILVCFSGLSIYRRYARKTFISYWVVLALPLSMAFQPRCIYVVQSLFLVFFYFSL